MSTGLSIGATFIATVFGISGNILAMIICGLAGFASLVWGFWPWIQLKLRLTGGRDIGPLILREKVMPLAVPDELEAQAMMTVAFSDPQFSLIEVENDGTKSIFGLIPEIYIDGSKVTNLGAWTTDRGKHFDPLGVNGVQLNVGATRLLVLAVGFPSKKHHSGGGTWYPVLSDMEPKHYFDQVRILANDRALGTSLDVQVCFRAEGVRQLKRFRLMFASDGSPTVGPPVASLVP